MRPRQVEVIRTALLTLLVIVAIVAPALAQGLPKAARPEDVGLSSDRLKRLTATFQADVENGKIPGAVILIARHGKSTGWPAAKAPVDQRRWPRIGWLTRGSSSGER